MNEKYVWLSPKEVQLMLQGSLQWIDIYPRVTSSKAGMRKLGEPLARAPMTEEKAQINLEPINLEPEIKYTSNGLEGQVVIWLLGGVGLLTLSSWFYFVLFSD
ncbi:hypothetical protein Desor_0204 [Desulfosporosinus orientis DSM 765]|uniref:Uncharacterized protein n=1 Tax=Desulfosporosinus orientis (strain ATCC 19365 / DSM 765 / NCIMB 8382 / VKM B-1628 / Singapore I) TaxID=768706 RepID=G7W7K4_DESOD|nr:hypothetical protein Desor_0204 [Desulfosporosinus orientis DSM 765]